jgi:hypothetical protein
MVLAAHASHPIELTRNIHSVMRIQRKTFHGQGFNFKTAQLQASPYRGLELAGGDQTGVIKSESSEQI